MVTTVSVAVGLVAGNYIYQILSCAPDYAVASERSFFQVMALAALIAVQAARGA
jgi:hypothetical protein